MWVTYRGGDCFRLLSSLEIREIMEKMGGGICRNFYQPYLARTRCDGGGQDSERSFTKRRNVVFTNIPRVFLINIIAHSQ